MNALNPLQLELLKLFKNYTSEDELLDLKIVLVDYLSKKVIFEADKVFDEKRYNEETLEKWKSEHNRSKS
jgi:hypothetical protein